ncbi:MAG: HD domain-containing protein [Deltaproteobacteria bacterium]|nr:HD domain-containing protein [Deltaproteobacteria bacterium]
MPNPPRSTPAPSHEPAWWKAAHAAGAAVAGLGAARLLFSDAVPPAIGWDERIVRPAALADPELWAPLGAADALSAASLAAALVDDVRSKVAPSLAAGRLRALAVAVLAGGEVLDPHDAGRDWREGVLRAVGDPRQLWRFDPAAMIEIAAIAAHTGLVPDRDLLRAVQRDAVLVLHADRERWQQAVGAMLLGPRAAVGLRFLHAAGVLSLLVPEVTALCEFHRSCSVHHKDIWDHTLQVVEKCPPNLVVRWAALMHDTGKVHTRTVQKGRVHFFGHEALGASLMEGVAGRFHMAEPVARRIVYVIGNHARANAYLANWTDSAVRRLVRDMGEHLDDVLAFSRSDYTTKRSTRQAEVQTLTAQLAGHIAEVVAEDSKVPPLPKGLGNHILAQTGLQPGPWLGRVQQWLEAQCETGALQAQRDADYYLQAVRAGAPHLLAIEPGTERDRRPKSPEVTQRARERSAR